MSNNINELIRLLEDLKRAFQTNNVQTIRAAGVKAAEKTVAILNEYEQRISNLEKPKQ